MDCHCQCQCHCHCHLASRPQFRRNGPVGQLVLEVAISFSEEATSEVFGCLRQEIEIMIVYQDVAARSVAANMVMT